MGKLDLWTITGYLINVTSKYREKDIIDYNFSNIQSVVSDFVQMCASISKTFTVDR